LERILVKNQYPNYEKLCIKPRMGVKFMAQVKKTLPDSKNFLVTVLSFFSQHFEQSWR
jgi:hypothetical protein